MYNNFLIRNLLEKKKKIKIEVDDFRGWNEELIIN